MAKTLEDLMDEGYSAKAAKAIISAQQKKKELQDTADAVSNLGKNAKNRKQTIDDIMDWQNGK